MNNETTDIEVLRERTKRKILSINNLPSIPEIVTQISDLLDKPQTSVQELSRLLSKDQALVTKILRVANSPFYGLPRKVSTIDFAIVILGFNHVKNIVIAMTAIDAFNSSGSGWNRKDFWLHSILTASLAKKISDDFGYRKSGEVFIAGLLHDLGISILNKFFNDEYTEIYNLILQKDMAPLEAERQVTGLTHPEIGKALAEKWNLPDILIEAILCHHNPSSAENYPEIAAIIHLADYLTEKAKIGNLIWDTNLQFDRNIIGILNFRDEDYMNIVINEYENLITEHLESVIL